MMKTYAELFQLKVLIDGKPIQEYHKDERTFVEGRQGSNFSLELTNLTPRRILVHPTVDGLSAMSGKEASRLDDDGYVLHAFQKTTIPGWRLNNDEVARFFFAGAGKSYAEKSGKGLDKGVIACAVWEEKQIIVPETVYYSSNELHTEMHSEEQCSGSLSWMPSDHHPRNRSITRGRRHTKGGMHVNCCSTQNLGTGFGERAQHEVHTTTFDKATDSPVVIATIYYDDLKGLRAQGINIRRQKSKRLPDPFPADKGCNPPNGWRG
jgi:hypothetical protein